METPMVCVSTVLDTNLQVVDSAISGLLAANSGLVGLEGHKAVMRRDYRILNQVRILSGGCSGFEPMFTGFVGPGMLTAAIVGDRYRVPPFPSILAVIRELAVGNPYGVLIILMNHPINKINFMLAVENAIREHIAVKLLFVGDDCSGTVSKHGRKGLAGLSFMFKIAGAMADQKRTMEEIFNKCFEICAEDISTISVDIVSKHREATLRSSEEILSLGAGGGYNSSDTISKLIQIRQDFAEVAQSVSATHPFSSIPELAKTLLGYLVFGTVSSYSINIADNDSVAILVNNYGSILSLELSSLVNELNLELGQRTKVERIYVGSVIGSRTTDGFSVTVMKVNDELVSYLDHPVTVAGWPVTILYKSDSPLLKCVKGQPNFNEEPKMLGPILNSKDSEKVRRALEFVCMALMSCEEQVNKLDPRSVTYGTHVKLTAEMMMEALYNNVLKVNCPFALFSQLSAICSNYLQDVSGSFYAVFFDAASQSFLKYFNETGIKPSMWTDALSCGIEAIEFYFGVKRGDRTLLDGLSPMLEVMQKLPNSYVLIAEAAELGSLSTLDADVKAHCMPDPSTHVVSLWVRAAVEGLMSFETTQDDDLEQVSNGGSFDDDDVLSIE